MFHMKHNKYILKNILLKNKKSKIKILNIKIYFKRFMFHVELNRKNIIKI